MPESVPGIASLKASIERKLPSPPIKEGVIKPKEVASSIQSCKSSSALLESFQIFDRMSLISHAASKEKIQELELCLKQLEKAWKAHSEKAIEADELVAAYSFWSRIQDFFTLITGAFATVLGISSLSSGNIATGSFLLGSASLSFANLVMKYGNLWDSIAQAIAPKDQELKSTIATYLPLAFTAAACGLTIYGGYSAFVSGAAVTTGSSWIRMFQTATNLATACALIATGRGGAKVDWNRAEMIRIERDIENLQEKHEEIVKNFQDMVKKQTEDAETVAGMTEAAISALLITSKPV